MEWPLLFKSTESLEEVIYKLLLQILQIKRGQKGGRNRRDAEERVRQKERESETEPPTLFLIYSSCLRFLLESKRKKKE